MHTETVSVAVGDGTTMRSYVARPDGGQQKGIIVLQEAFGVNEYIKSIVERFAQEGYITIAPELFHRTAPAGFTAAYTDYPAVKPQLEGLTLDGQIADIKAAHAWLVSQGITNIAAVGFCMGGRAVFLASTVVPLKAAVSFYGGGVAQTLLDRTKDLAAPIMLLWGGKDAHILPEHRRAVADALTKEGKEFINVEFSAADHGFFCDMRPAYHADSAREAWALVKEFLAVRFER